MVQFFANFHAAVISSNFGAPYTYGDQTLKFVGFIHAWIRLMTADTIKIYNENYELIFYGVLWNLSFV